MLDGGLKSFHLSEAALRQIDSLLELESEAMAAMISSAALVAGHAELFELLGECRKRIVDGNGQAASSIAAQVEALLRERETLLIAVMGRQRAMFAALLVAVTVPWTAARYEERGIPRSVLIDTMSDLSVWMNHALQESGEWGLHNIDWLLHHVTLRLFRLGRLQFCLETFDYPAVFLRHASDGRLAALSEADVVYREDGQVDGTNGIEDPAGRWTSRLTRAHGCWTGNPFGAAGQALRETAVFPEAEWTVELRRGDAVASVHIAEGSRMPLEQCVDSLNRALIFYDRFFPEASLRAFVCSSWLLDPQFGRILPSSSNIVRFQSLFYLLPLLSDEKETYWRVFGAREFDPSTAPADTGLRKAVRDYAAGGNRMRAAVGVLPRADVFPLTAGDS